MTSVQKLLKTTSKILRQNSHCHNLKEKNRWQYEALLCIRNNKFDFKKRKKKKTCKQKQNCATHSDHEDSLTDVTNAIIHQARCINEFVLIHRLWGVCTQGFHCRLHLLCKPWHDYRKQRWSWSVPLSIWCGFSWQLYVEWIVSAV